MTRLEKLMSLTFTEFEANWPAFDASPAPVPGMPVCLAVGRGQVAIAYEPQANVRLGGLLDLPRALVSFTFDRVEPEECAALLARFDRAFQRGGG